MSEPKSVYVLIAPVGQLSGNGQLRETVEERRNRKGDDVPFWYLSPTLLEKFNLGGSDYEGVVAEELTAINWLQLRFGGESSVAQIDIDQLRELATALPPPPTFRDISG
tara:strand:- start:4889 stop:5215 length:327 start_codon:yes stop_codon:yes gene_type:complete